MFIGSEIRFDRRLNAAERFYIKMLGVPISGLRIRARHILPYLKGTYKRLLDAGCGLGVFSIEMAKRLEDAEVIGIDTDEEQIRVNNMIAQQAGLNNLHFEVAERINPIKRERFARSVADLG